MYNNYQENVSHLQYNLIWIWIQIGFIYYEI